MADFDFNAVLGAVGSYYGTGSDQWVEFAKYGLQADNLYDTLKHVPGVDIVYTDSGKVVGATVSKNFSGVSSGVAGAMDSNLQVPTQGNGTTFASKIPMNGSYNQTTGAAEMTSGAKAASGGATVATVMDKVALGVAGVSLGAKLGAWIDRNLYEAAPDWWDQHFPEINPSKWADIATTQGGKSFLSSLFGIKEINGKQTGTMYLDENAIGYMAYAMAQNGFFSSGETYYDTSDVDKTQLVGGNIYPNAIQTGGLGSLTVKADSAGNMFTYTTGSGSPIYLTIKGGTATNVTVLAVSTAPFTVNRYYMGELNFTINSSTDRYNGITYYTAQVAGGYPGNNIFGFPPVNACNNQSSYSGSSWDWAYLVFNGTEHTISPVDGVTQQPGATFPDTTGWNDPDSALAALRAAHPDWWNDAVTLDVPQPDGTTQRYTYVPMPVTGTTGANDPDPTNTTITQGDTGTVDDTATTDLINTLIRYITQTHTDTPTTTPTPPDTPNPDPTGDGTTPPVVAPTGQASALFAVYNPSQAALNSFGAWLWSSNFIDQVLKLFNNPMQSIIGLHKIFAAPPISGSGTIRVGYLDSGVGSNLVGGQYVTVNCGTVNVREQYGNVFDYTDTHIRLYLPFIGIVPLDTADVMRGAVTVVYHVDVITGACLAEVKVSRDSGGGTLYQYAGDAAVRYPISSGSYMGVVSGVLGVVGGIASAVMTGGASAPLAAGAVASGIANAKTDVQHSGSFAGNAGAMGGKKPYLIIERPQTAVASGYSAYQGTGANAVHKVSAMSGYFRMTDVHVDNVARASAEELEQIRTMIERGVIK